jgi:predicted nucleotidyltransferase component of viral defense system
MKKLPPAVVQRITDFESESGLSLPAYALEKDHIILEVLKLIMSIPADPYFRFVFCGGTCLAKAYGVLERMSEDVDFKLVPTPAATALTKTALRQKLRAFVQKIVEKLQESEFGATSINRRSQDQSKYSALDIQYESAFSKPISLRAHVLVELNYATLESPTQILDVGLLLDKLILGTYQLPLKIECASLVEALAEKLVAFPRRLSLQIERSIHSPPEQDENWDKSLVRHLYDVSQIIAQHSMTQSESLELARIVSIVLKSDALEFASQHPKFFSDPYGQIQETMAWAANSAALQSQYESFVQDMVYAPTERKPNFQKVLSIFTSALTGATVGKK